MTPDPRHTASLAGVMMLAMVPHLFRLPWWMTVPAVLCWGYAGAGALRRWPWPGSGMLRGMAVACFGLTLVSFGTGLGGEAGVGLLALMAGLKIFETRTYRDRMVAVFLTYFLLITTVLFSESLLTTLYMLLCVIPTTGVLIGFHHRQGRFPDHWKLGGKILLQALPLTVVLFLLFPRVQGSLWGIHNPSRGLTGFSESMAPGSVSNLARSTEIAFRVDFEGTRPPAGRLYWRGIVFWRFDGRIWHPFRNVPPRQIPAAGREAVSYTIALEPHGSRWLFSLDYPRYSPPGSMLMADQTISTVRRIQSAVRYRLSSYLDLRTGPMRAWEQIALRLPESGNDRARGLARQFRADAGGDPAAIVQKGLDYFRRNGFVYTLEPPLLGGDPVDEFLFDTRKGYCEHYAGAFAFLMRAAGVPTRVVGGYLGGEVNPYGDYLIVRQSDAHAWTEVWLAGNGWTRVDPTSAVAPQRVDSGMAAALPPDEIPRGVPFFIPGGLDDLFRRTVLAWDAVNSGWGRWVMGYSSLRQRRFLEQIGIENRSWQGPLVGALIGAAVCLLLVLAYAVRLRPPEAAADPAARAYQRYCRKLARIGIVRVPSDGPLDFCEQVAARRPDLLAESREITEHYVRLRYAGQGGRKEQLRLESLVRRFRPGR